LISITHLRSLMNNSWIYTEIGDWIQFQADFLELKETGIYGFIRHDTILEFGKIQIDEQTTERLKITFFPDNAVDNIFFYDSEKYIRLAGKDSLNLYSPCCDRYNYHFVRVQ